MKKVRLRFNLEKGELKSFPFISPNKGYKHTHKPFTDLLYNVINHPIELGYKDYERPKYI